MGKEVKTMYEGLVKQCRDCLDSLCGECKYEHLQKPGNFVVCMNALLREAADAIESLDDIAQTYAETVQELKMKSQWISVTERLPEPDKTDSNGFAVQYLVMNGWRKAVARRTDKYWVLFGTSIVLEYVTHWMTLPEPPKEET